MQIFLCFPGVCWTKVNIDGVARRDPNFAGCGDMFRGSCSNYVSSFYAFLVFNMLFMVRSFC